MIAADAGSDVPSSSTMGRTTGTVTGFDEHSGLGLVTSADGAVIAFHCVSIADGTRTIDVGTAVSFSYLAKLGRFEAADIRPC